MEELSTRRRIYEEIVLNPGLHFRELQKRLDMPTGMLEYHLRILEKEELIVSKMDGKYKRYFANSSMTQEERRIMSALRGDVSRKIIIYLLEHGSAGHAELAAAVNIKPSALTYHAKILVKKGVIEREKQGREVKYRIVNPNAVTRTIIRYRKSFIDSLVDNFVEWYLGKT